MLLEYASERSRGRVRLRDERAVSGWAMLRTRGARTAGARTAPETTSAPKIAMLTPSRATPGARDGRHGRQWARRTGYLKAPETSGRPCATRG
jgi:hypothetical protein